MRDLEIAVLGAGIVGVNTALRIQQEYPSAKITIIDDKFNETTLSYGPPGLFCPSSNFGGIATDLARSFTQTSYEFYQQLLSVPSSGILPLTGYVISDTDENNVKNDVVQTVLPCYRSTTANERNFNSKTWKYGSYLETIRIHCPSFIPWALNKFKQQGGLTLKKYIENFNELQNKYDVVFNCAGFNAKNLCKDKFMVPIRGQILRVYAPQIKQFYMNDSNTYIIPLGNGTVCLGGCREYDNYNSEVDEFDTQSILKRCSEIVPSLEGIDILNQWVGLRPHRNVIRLEVENLGRMKIVHNYGHGGFGITTSPGTADHVVKLFKNSHSTKSNL